jgi:nucleoside-diphosphate-sugar epimerase
MNAVYIDNLVHAVLLALTEPQAAGQSFLIGEDQTPTWREYSNRLRVAMDLPPEVIHDVGFETRAPTFSDRINTLRESKAVRATLRRLPYPLQEALAAGWSATGMMPVQTGEPMANLETALLHRARHVPTWEKARTMLKYQPLISAEEAWARTIAWLKFAGYSTSAS